MLTYIWSSNDFINSKSYLSPLCIVMAAVQYFREIGENEAAYVLKKMKEDPKIGKDLKQFLVDSPELLKSYLKFLSQDVLHTFWIEA